MDDSGARTQRWLRSQRMIDTATRDAAGGSRLATATTTVPTGSISRVVFTPGAPPPHPTPTRPCSRATVRS